MDAFGSGRSTGADAARQMTDEQAIERYRYLLATAPPEDIERAHEEAFARLTPDQRRQALEALARVVPPNELRGDDPASLARAATRAEVRQPGTIERVWGSGAPGLGSWFFATLAGSFVGTAIAQAFLPGDVPVAGAAEAEADGGGYDAGSDEYGGDIADAGDFGGGDFGGGDFGDFGGI